MIIFLSSSRISAISQTEASVWSRFPAHLQDSWPVAGRACGRPGRPFWPGLRQPRESAARANRARVRHAVPPQAEHLPREGMGEERDECHGGPSGTETRSEHQVPDPGLCYRVYSRAQPLHGGQREEKRGHGAAAAR